MKIVLPKVQARQFVGGPSVKAVITVSSVVRNIQAIGGVRE